MEEINANVITELLNSPDLMNGVKQLLGSVSDGSTQENDVSNNSLPSLFSALTSSEENHLISTLKSILSENRNERIALLSALRPFLSKEKQEIVDLVVKLLKATSLFATANLFK